MDADDMRRFREELSESAKMEQKEKRREGYSQPKFPPENMAMRGSRGKC